MASLPEETLRSIFALLPRSGAFLRGASSAWRRACGDGEEECGTSFRAAVDSRSALQYCLELGAPPKRLSWAAARGGKVDTLEYLSDAGLCDLDEHVCSEAAAAGQLDLLAWLLGRNEAACRDEETAHSAALSGQHAVLAWAAAHGCHLSADVMAAAASSGCPRSVSILLEAGCPADEEACSEAASGGHTPILKLLRAGDSPAPWSAATCAEAASGGHLETLQWLRSAGCEWDAATCSLAAAAGQLDALRWAHENGCDWNEWAWKLAARFGHVHVLRWLGDNGAATGAAHAALVASSEPSEESRILEWARSHGCPWYVGIVGCHEQEQQQQQEQEGVPPPASEEEEERAAVEAMLSWARAHGCPLIA